MAIDCKSLMIGDWVYFKTNKIYAKITEIYFTLDVEHKYMVSLNSRGNRYCVSINEIEPIPLTVEILEVNGFDKDDYNYYYRNDDENLEITFFPKDKNYTRGSYDYISINRGCVTIDEFPIEHVHQFQHVLRLCGIDEEITIK